MQSEEVIAATQLLPLLTGAALSSLFMLVSQELSLTKPCTSVSTSEFSSRETDLWE
jgi:hypothetical protein